MRKVAWDSSGALEQEPVEVVARKSRIVAVDESVVDDAKVRIHREEFGAPIALEEAVVVALIRNLNRFRVEILAHQYVSSARTGHCLVAARKEVGIQVYQDPLHEHEIPLPTIRLPRQNRFLKDLRPVDDLDELLCGVSGDLYCRQVRIGEQQSQRTQVHADVGAQLKMDAGGCFAVNARANSARLVASR